MNTNPILIRNINHLTDARYFAAMGVDWMSMALTNDAQSFATWHTLSDWISGVKLAAEIDAGDEMLLAKTIIDAKPEGIVTNKIIPEGIPSEIKHFLAFDSVNTAEIPSDVISVFQYDPNLPKEVLLNKDPNKIFLVADWTPESLKGLLAKGYTGGICFSGGEEEEVGMRDYEEMDILLELLQ